MVNPVGNNRPVHRAHKPEDKRNANADKDSSPTTRHNRFEDRERRDPVNSPSGGLDPKAQFDVTQGLRNRDRGEAGNTGKTGDSQKDTSTKGPEGAAGSSGQPVEGDVGQWISQAQDALRGAGISEDQMSAEDIAQIIQHESSGDPNAVNNHDGNAQNGTPSTGLMQTIPPTFDAYKLPGHDTITNPVDNIIAGVRYAVDKYGSVSNVPGLVALRNGQEYVGY